MAVLERVSEPIGGCPGETRRLATPGLQPIKALNYSGKDRPGVASATLWRTCNMGVERACCKATTLRRSAGLRAPRGRSPASRLVSTQFGRERQLL
jgi:hypothetical protein